MSKVSVVIPVFNGETFVGEAIQSVVAQTYKNLEIIVVNDGSTDRTAEIVSGVEDPRLQLVSQANQGLPAARNAGIKVATGEFIAFLDSDDVWYPDKLKRQVEILRQRPHTGLVYGGYDVTDSIGTTIHTRSAAEIPDPQLRYLIRSNLVAGSATTSVVRRSCIEQVGTFDESLVACEDWDLWLRIARHFKLECIQGPVAKIRIHSGNMTGQADKMERGLLSVVDKVFSNPDVPVEIKGRHKEAYSGAKLQSAVFFERSGDRRRATTRLLQSIEADASWADPYIVLVRVITRIDVTRITRSIRSRIRRSRMNMSVEPNGTSTS